MPKKPYDIDIRSFLRTLKLETFTVSDITNRLLETHSNLFYKKENAAQFVYRHLKSLERQGVIKTLTKNKNKAILFSLSDQSKEIDKLQNFTQDVASANQLIISKLKEKIHHYKSEMLASIGEAEAYSEWVSEMPELEDDVKSDYQKTRDQAKLMLGKVKGFERLLAQYKGRS